MSLCLSSNVSFEDFSFKNILLTVDSHVLSLFLLPSLKPVKTVKDNLCPKYCTYLSGYKNHINFLLCKCQREFKVNRKNRESTSLKVELKITMLKDEEEWEGIKGNTK